ncbi:alpha/beta hydrolase [Curtobacterium sp. 9128]|uniref:alpha/beta hydrolase n=1 Tax=Curtobacterium sp. 9128 TaxID=1793722 RepID=UPI00119DE56C|nr:alpha/beta hydrolase [Curtobacterium sp. 9128]
MGAIEFDDAAASNLETAAGSAADRLRGQSGTRRAAADDASTDFSGAYADRFAAAALAESTDRPKLASVLSDLRSQVRTVAAEAERERKRLADHAAWEARDQARRVAVAADTVHAVTAWGEGLLDPQPPDTPIRPTPIDASFSPQERSRSAGGGTNGRSSADPSRLRSFARESRAADTAANEELHQLQTAWSTFVATCGWAPVDSATFLGGFERLLTENAADAAWADQIADAFDRAGGGHSVADAALDIVLSGALPTALRDLLAAGLSPSEVASRWGALDWAGGSPDDVADLKALPLAVLAQIGNLEGTPYWARGVANRAVLDARLAAAERNHGPDLPALRDITATLDDKTHPGPGRTLISLTTDSPPLAAISIGNLDTATNVTWAIPGMGSSTEKMSDWTDAAQNVYNEQATVHGDPNHAVVAWMGYKAPPIPGNGNVDLGVFHSDYAEKGADHLADALRGFDAARSNSLVHTNVVAHSYGTTTASIALTESDVHVDTFTTVASAGIPDDIPSASSIHATHMYSGQARDVTPLVERDQGDQWAHIGRDHSTDHHKDPTDPDFGSTTFGADGDDSLKGVTDHGVHTGGNTGYLDRGTESLRNVAYATTGQPDRMTEARPPEPTWFDEQYAHRQPTP